MHSWKYEVGSAQLETDEVSSAQLETYEVGSTQLESKYVEQVLCGLLSCLQLRHRGHGGDHSHQGHHGNHSHNTDKIYHKHFRKIVFLIPKN